MEISWDPIEVGASSTFYDATIKRQIRNILKSYTGWFDPLCELVQNAIDAVENRKRIEDSYTPTIWVQIDLKGNTISITDNGIGFSEEQFRSFLAPNVSFKTPSDRGNKGVGATYLGYGFNFLQAGTRTQNYSFIGTLEGGREWVEDDSEVEPRPNIQKSEAIHDIFNEVDQGSTFSLRLVGDFIRPKDLKWAGANNSDQWEAVLRIKTPIGGIYFTRDCLLPLCKLRVIDENGLMTEKDITECQYIYPHKVISTCRALKEIWKAQQDLLKRGKDAANLPDSFYKLNGLYNYWNYKDILSEDSEFKGEWSEQELTLAEKYRVSFYAFFGYSTDIWDTYNDQIVGLRKGNRILKGGIQIATNCMPQGELLIIPLTQNIGYQNVTHVVVHFEEADPDLGRKGFQPELESFAQHIGTAVVGAFLPWRKLLKKETGAPPDIVGLKNIHDWIKEQEEHEKDNPLLITRQDVFLPTREPAMTSKPSSEQDVIALFNQLLAGGVIRGVKLMATNQHQQYDGIYRFRLIKPFDNHRYDEDKNPLGLLETSLKQEFISAPDIIEYKYSFDGLIEEIEKGDKNERDIQLLVAWEMGTKWPTRYQITPLLHFDNLQHRYFHGGTHVVKNSMTGDTVFPLIILSELIDYINDPKGVQDHQSTYL